jgi:argininosuccinate synthase
VVVDARAEMAEELRAARHLCQRQLRGKYPLVSALSRPVIVKHLVAAARQYGADAVAHGCTGKGNDQVRFEVGTGRSPRSRDPRPRAHLGHEPRAVRRVRANVTGIPVEATKEKIYSIDENLWGRAIECGEMEDPWAGRPTTRTSSPAPPRPSRPRS